MSKIIKIFRDMPAHQYQTQKDHKTDVNFASAHDAHGQTLTHMDKILFSSGSGWYYYGYYLGATESGKNAKVMHFSPTARNYHNLEISSLSAGNLLKIDWNDQVCPNFLPVIQEVFDQLSLGLNVIEVR